MCQLLHAIGILKANWSGGVSEKGAVRQLPTSFSPHVVLLTSHLFPLTASFPPLTFT
jgi:hypothetical protein